MKPPVILELDGRKTRIQVRPLKYHQNLNYTETIFGKTAIEIDKTQKFLDFLPEIEEGFCNHQTFQVQPKIVLKLLSL